jgi:hypothetical protein
VTRRRIPPLAVVFWIILLDYLAQVPYYLVNYFLPHHVAPTVTAVVLLSLTLVWFLGGYIALRSGRPFGYWLLLSFLLVEGLFYLTTLLFGSAALQLENPNPLNKIVFVIGYLTGIVSLFYFVVILVLRDRYLVTKAPRRGRART